MPQDAETIPTSRELQAQRDALLLVRDDHTLPEERRRAARRAILKLDSRAGELAEERIAARTEVFRLLQEALSDAAAPLQRSAAGQIVEAVDGVAASTRAAIEEEISKVLHHKDEPVGVDLRAAANVKVSAEATSEQKDIIKSIVEAAAEHGLSERFLGAVAFKESSLRNVKAAASSAFGPFQFLQSTWNGLVAQVGEELGIGEADIRNVDKQAIVAAIAFKHYQRTLERAGQPVTPASLYFCHLLGEGAATACLARMALPIDQALRDFYQGTELGAGFAEEIVSANPLLKDEGGAPHTVESVLSIIGEALERCEGKYLALKGAAPTGNKDSAPTWLRIAFSEMDRGVHEIAGERHEDAIVSYLASTTLPERLHQDETAWCSAFVNWCIEQAGQNGTDLANARSWLEFGEKVEVPQLGDIVVFWREKRDGPFGHVGFFIDEDDDNVMVLGGNQTDPEKGVGAVCIKPYSRKRLLGFRRPPSA